MGGEGCGRKAVLSLGCVGESRAVSVLPPAICSSSHCPNPPPDLPLLFTGHKCPALRVNSEAFQSIFLGLSVSSSLSPCSPLSFLQCCFPELWPVFCASHSDCPLSRVFGPQTSVAISRLMVHFWCSALILSSLSVPCTHPTYMSKCGSHKGLRLHVPMSGRVVPLQACFSFFLLHPQMSVSSILPRTEKHMSTLISSPSAPLRSGQINWIPLSCLPFSLSSVTRWVPALSSASGVLCQPRVEPFHPTSRVLHVLLLLPQTAFPPSLPAQGVTCPHFRCYFWEVFL